MKIKLMKSFLSGVALAFLLFGHVYIFLFMAIGLALFGKPYLLIFFALLYDLAFFGMNSNREFLLLSPIIYLIAVLAIFVRKRFLW